MTQFMGRFSVTAGARSLAVCRAIGRHHGADMKGRCSACGLQLPDPELPTPEDPASD